VEPFDEASALVTRLSTHDRGCLLLDVHEERPGALGLQRALEARGVVLPVIFTSSRADVRTAVAAMKQGALDFLSKPIDPRELVAVVDHALRRDAAAAAAREARDLALTRWAALSPRERDVCSLVARGLLNKQIAAALGTAEVTVQAQRARAFRKLRLESVPDLVRLVDHLDAGSPAPALGAGPA
jgi:FixJ family two-component response regulator